MERSLWENTLRTRVACRENAVERNRIQPGSCTREGKDHSSFQQERSGVKNMLHSSSHPSFLPSLPSSFPLYPPHPEPKQGEEGNQAGVSEGGL